MKCDGSISIGGMQRELGLHDMDVGNYVEDYIHL